MRTARVTFNTGDVIVTSINGTDQEIRDYYLGKDFNLGDGAGGDRMARAVKVEILKGRQGMRILVCCSCGGEAPGRQWWNRDTGYGICPRCFEIWVKKLGREEAEFSCGKPGEHHSINHPELQFDWEDHAKRYEPV